MAPSPTSLLWAHQLKREHGFLLQRMQDLESRGSEQEARIASAEEAAAPANGVAGLAAQVKAIKDAGVSVGAGVEKRMDELELHAKRRLDEMQGESEAMNAQLLSLQDGQAEAAEACERAEGRAQVLIQRIGELEVGLKKYESSLERMGKRLDGAQFAQIKVRMEDLSEQVRTQGEQMLFLPESIRALEASGAELKRALEKNEGEMKKMVAKAAVGGVVMHGEAGAAEPSAGADAEMQPREKKKSHKWSGGGADRDIIRLGADSYGGSNAPRRSPQATRTEKSKKSVTAILPAARKNLQPPIARSSPVTGAGQSVAPKKSHKWAGGGADRDVVQAGILRPSDSPRRRSIEQTGNAIQQDQHEIPQAANTGPGALQGSSSTTTSKASPTSLLTTKSTTPNQSTATVPEVGPNEFVSRRGKGWYEVVSPASAAPAAPPVKRKRGRPRKENAPPQWTAEEALTQGRSTRRNVYQLQDQSALPPRRLTEVSFEDDETEGSPAIKRERIAETPLPAVHDPPAEDSIRETTMAGVSIPVEAETTVADTAVEALPIAQTSEAQPRAPQPQRQILQKEDLATFKSYLPS